MTRLLTRSDLTGLLDTGGCLTALREGFTRYESVEVAGQRVRTDLPFPGTATALLPGLLPGIPAFTLKVNAKFPGADPALRGTICLHDGRDGVLLALADSATITAWRTGLAAALATDLLAADSSTVGVIGAGAQSALMVRGLAGLRDIDRLVVCDRNAAIAREFVARFAESGLDGTIVVTPREVAAVSDVAACGADRVPRTHCVRARRSAVAGPLPHVGRIPTVRTGGSRKRCRPPLLNTPIRCHGRDTIRRRNDRGCRSTQSINKRSAT